MQCELGPPNSMCCVMENQFKKQTIIEAIFLQVVESFSITRALCATECHRVSILYFHPHNFVFPLYSSPLYTFIHFLLLFICLCRANSGGNIHKISMLLRLHPFTLLLLLFLIITLSLSFLTLFHIGSLTHFFPLLSLTLSE